MKGGERGGREGELRKEGCELPSRSSSSQGPIGVRFTLGQPTTRRFWTCPATKMFFFNGGRVA